MTGGEGRVKEGGRGQRDWEDLLHGLHESMKGRFLAEREMTKKTEGKVCQLQKMLI